MARETTVKCDASGCRKVPGDAHDHVLITFGHRVAAQEPLVGGQTIGEGRLDFCSWEHAAQWVRDHAEEAEAARADAIEEAGARDEARQQAGADAAAAREAAEQAAAAENDSGEG